MIILDMEMPKSCKDCNLRNIFDDCAATRNDVADEVYTDIKAESCPIKAELPKDATNGDVIKALFSDAEYKDRRNITIDMRNTENGELQLTGMADKEWWNAPWKGQKNEPR